jgi:23S rRNA maturation mini-RNase III
MRSAHIAFPIEILVKSEAFFESMKADASAVPRSLQHIPEHFQPVKKRGNNAKMLTRLSRDDKEFHYSTREI